MIPAHTSSWYNQPFGGVSDEGYSASGLLRFPPPAVGGCHRPQRFAARVKNLDLLSIQGVPDRDHPNGNSTARPLARPRRSPKPSPSPLRWLLPLALIVVAGIGGGWWWMHVEESSQARRDAGTPRANITGPRPGRRPIHVEVVHPQKGGIVRTSTQPGSVHWFEAAELYAKISGYLKEQSVDIGDRGEAGPAPGRHR